MANIDSSIYANIQPIDIMGSIQRGLSMRDMLDQRKLRQQGLEKDQKIDQAYQSGIVQNPDGTSSIDSSRTLSALANISGAGKETMDFNDKIRAQNASMNEQNIKAQAQKLDLTARLAGSATDQPSYDNALAQAKQMGIDVSQLPRQYDQNLMKRYQMSALSAKEQLEHKLKQSANDMSQQKLSMDKLKSQSDIEKTKAETAKLRAEAKIKSTGSNEGIKALDRDYAKDYNDFVGNGEVKAKDAISKLKDLRKSMANDNGMFQAGGGPIAGSMPDAFRTQSSIAQRDNIVSAANSALKSTFGGQLSDGERKALANEFYNDRLSNEENLKIIDRKIQELENGFFAQREKARYFRKNRTLNGFGENQSSAESQNSNKPAWAK